MYLHIRIATAKPHTKNQQSSCWTKILFLRDYYKSHAHIWYCLKRRSSKNTLTWKRNCENSTILKVFLKT